MAGGYDRKAIEEDARKLWREIRLLDLLERQNKDGPKYFLLDGPPYANNIPHVGHVRNTVYKDLYLRYAMMRGMSVLFQPGFDTHGLPIENMVEKQLGITSKQQIEEIGIENFTRKCKESAALNKDLWLEVYELLGSWYSWKAPYLTYDNSYIQSAWWAFAQAWKSGFVYEGKRPVHWCPHCQTALAGYEVTDSYKVISDPGVYVKFKVKGMEDTYLLVFTTTPWTLPSNVALVVNGKEPYVKARTKEHGTLILAQALTGLLERVGVGFEVIETLKGEQLDGLRYEPLMDVPIQQQLRNEPNALRVFLSIPLLKERVASKVGAKKGLDKKDLFEDFVTVTDGTGIVHCAPGHGHTDNEVGKHYHMPELSPLDDEARFTAEVGKYAGQQVREASHAIADDLAKEGKLLHFERIEHSYPLCWRCKTPLIFRLSTQWFFRIEPIKEALLDSNEQVRWQPGYAQERMRHWVVNAGDWNFSRQRYWGIPIPIWRCECGERRVIASEQELRDAATGDIPADADLHAAGLYRISCDCGGQMAKVPDIFDVWYDSGCASFASLGYPYQNKELFESHYPISRINESQDQIRGWFYHLLFVGQMTFGKRPLEAISMPGWVVDEKGEKMSKSLGNVVGAKEGIEEFGADPLRFYYCWDIAPYELQKFSKTTLKTEVTKMFTILWNLVTLAQQLPQEAGGEPAATEDRWLLSRRNTVLAKYFAGLDGFELHEGCRAIYEFIVNDISRTYVQFTRERADEDPRVGTLLRQTLLDVLVALAPIAPHVSEMGYQRLRAEGMPLSVHLCRFPELQLPEPALEEELSVLQEILGGVLAARDKAQIGLRWPIAEARVFGDDRFLAVVEQHRELLLLKANLKEIGASPIPITLDIAPDAGALGKLLGQETALFLEAFPKLKPQIIEALQSDEDFSWNGHDLNSDHFNVAQMPPSGWVCMPCGDGLACVSTTRTPELEAEGFAREVIRRIQQLRKTAGLVKRDRIAVQIAGDVRVTAAVQEHREQVMEKTGAVRLEAVDAVHAQHRSEEKIKGAAFTVGFTVEHGRV